MERRELWIGLYVGFVWNEGVAAFLNNPIEPSRRVWFIVMGAANELLGVLMIASPELLPIIASLLARLYAQLRRFARWLGWHMRRIFHWPRAHFDNVTAGITATGSLQARVGRVAPTTLQDVIRWVTRHDQELQDHQERLNSMPDEWKMDIDKRAEQTEKLARALVKGLADRNLELRLLGVAFVVLGIFLSTAGNLVH